jgi:hypothetical protein
MAANAMISALDSEPNGVQQADGLRVELVVRGTTGPASALSCRSEPDQRARNQTVVSLGSRP